MDIFPGVLILDEDCDPDSNDKDGDDAIQNTMIIRKSMNN